MKAVLFVSMIKKLFFIFCLFFSFSSKASDFAYNEKWLSLVHYQKNIFSCYEGTIGSSEFYLSKDGKTNPKTELEATIDLFEKTNDEKRCLFPARYLLLKKEGLIKADFPKCTEFEEFKDDLKPAGVTMLFTDAYMNNSSSLFGHTLMRIDTSRQGTQMIAHGLNYGAFTKGYENTFLYAIYGLLGFYPGGLTTKPYYDTINTYNNIENRDIWEYNLNFSNEELEMFVAHVWEVGHTTTPYYFFSRNCSYMILEILDAVRPSLKLAQDFPTWTIPLDTIKAINKRGIVKQTNYRPSRLKKIKNRLEQMNKKQYKAFLKIAKDENADISDLSEQEKSDVLETAYQYVQYQYIAKKLELKDYRKKSLRILKERNKNKAGQTFDDLKEGNNPNFSHDSKQIAFFFGTQNGKAFEEFALRPAYHSLTDNPFGYLNGAGINFLQTYIRHYDKGDKYVLEKLSILELDSFSPIDRAFVAPSYRIKLDEIRDENLKTKKQGYVLQGEVSGGGTFELGKNSWVYVLSSVDGAYGGFLKDNAWVGVSGAAGLLLSFEKIGFQAELKKTLATQKHASVFKQSALVNYHIFKNTDIEAVFERKTCSSKSRTEIKIGLKQFF